EPLLRLSGEHLTYGLPNHVPDAGLYRKGRIGHHIAEVAQRTRFRIHLFDDAEAFIDRLKQCPVSLLALPQTPFRMLALTDVVKAIDCSRDFSSFVFQRTDIHDHGYARAVGPLDEHFR